MPLRCAVFAVASGLWAGNLLATDSPGANAAAATPPSASAPEVSAASRAYLDATSQRLCPGEPAPSPVAPEEIPRLLSDTQRGIGLAQDALAWGDVELASQLLCQALGERSAALGVAHPRTIVIFNNFGVLLRKQGRSAEARALLEQLVGIVSAYPPQGRPLAQSVLHNLATALFAQGYMAEAEATYRRILDEDDPNPAAPARRESTRTNLAFALEGQNRLREAEAEHRKVLAQRKSAGADQELEAAASMNNLGANLTAQGRLAEAEPLLRSGLEIRERVLGPRSLNTGFSLAALASNLAQQGKAAAALPLAQRLVELRRNAVGELHPETAAAFQLLATIALDAGQHSRALEASRLALAARVPETLREEAALSDSARMAIRSAPGSAALTLARAAWVAAGRKAASWDAGKPPALMAEAFVAAQKIPVSATAEALSHAAARRAAAGAGLGNLAQQLQNQLTARIELDRSLVDAVVQGKNGTELKSRQAKLDKDIADAEEALRRAYPDFFNYARPQPLGVDALSGPDGLLKDDEVLVLMTPGAGKHRGLVFAVTREGGAWAEIPLDAAALQAKIQRFRLLLDLASNRSADAPATISDVDDFDWTAAAELYTVLFSAPPVSSRLHAKKRWILAPQGVLLSLPYTALVPQRPTGATRGAPALRAADWLGIAKVLSITPSVASVQVLRTQATQGPRPSRPFFGVGDPVFAGAADADLPEATSYYRGGLADVDAVRRLARIPGTAKEIAELARQLGASRSDYLLGTQATETEIKRRNAQGELAQTSVVVFATHGLLNGDPHNSLAEPALALTPPAQPSENDDGLLAASEAAQLQLNADWVILSACNTAAGDRVNGEGLSGLTRAFLSAGGRGLVVSHWRVPDTVAGRITTRAVELSRTRSGLPRGQALQLAMQELIDDDSRDASSAPLSHPGIWAAFTYVGLD